MEPTGRGGARQRSNSGPVWSLQGGLLGWATAAAACVHSLMTTRSLSEWSHGVESLLIFWIFLVLTSYVAMEVSMRLFVGKLRVFERNRAKEKLLEKAVRKLSPDATPPSRRHIQKRRHPDTHTQGASTDVNICLHVYIYIYIYIYVYVYGHEQIYMCA
ncbi:Zinc finger (C3HC4 type, RING finger) protein,related [Neospora caninum Liverpool]|uniref:Zinc finger (C3HC4 type, RING finger) protein,related n=1 Tax=Neospora caninum (strain Liverpool) TaxID=572307 RepID=F0VHP0_NEOCL|nr:Zinc finger (C3HC4 type, RING finger) protein,related [Neospora caninum Liverpool]CBZ53251.1 Zinc finger (C3HC4 type, RING finger) protein,related [Neospora caninum Liverpool]|eukprot:XP_003883283.1 Zinc finger (C3HC4 type, RING finger) protein,related [Neospora caninum Liverpool]